VAQIYVLLKDRERRPYRNDDDDEGRAVSGSRRLPYPRSSTDTSSERFVPLPFQGNLPKLAYTLNRMLPFDVRVTGISSVLPAPATVPQKIAAAATTTEKYNYFHPSISCQSKTYRYTVSIGGQVHDPLQWRTAWQVDSASEFALDRVREACRALEGLGDFRAFRGAPRGPSDRQKYQAQSTTCRLFCVNVRRHQQDDADGSGGAIAPVPAASPLYGDDKTMSTTYVVEIRGDRFLYKMVRFIVGALVAVGTDQLRVRDVEDALETGVRRRNWECAPAHGLVLADVDYAGDAAIDWHQPLSVS